MGPHRHGALWAPAEENAVTRNYYAPPPESRTGVADYAESLRLVLAPRGPLPVPLYHLGNNQLHVGIYRRAVEQPGVVVLHDAVLHHLFLGLLTRDEYIAEFVYNYGEWRRHLAEELWRDRAASGVDPRYFEFPMIRRAVESARAVIVHNPGAASAARAHRAARVTVIPHFFEPAVVPDSAATAYFRERIGISHSATLFGIFGFLRETKRLLPCIRAFERLHALDPNTALLIAGQPVSPDLARVLEIEAAHPAIRSLGYLEPEDLPVAVAAVDCCLNLRYPAAGETSGIAIRVMGAGKPVILSDVKENEDIPAAACLRVRPGVAEAAELFDHMVMVSRFPQIAREIGHRAERHIREYHSLARAAERYWEVLCAAGSC
ncbi:MAG TPA: glycosyltransferase [Bryobacteraceae bacterium]|nr:glycosyltransferase [Bryobacteraceae bacterium]